MLDMYFDGKNQILPINQSIKKTLLQGEIDTLDNLLDTSRPQLKKKWEYELYRISMEQKVYQVII